MQDNNLCENNPTNIIKNILYNNITQIPFSIVKGISWISCLPSHVNLASKYKKYYFAKRCKDADGFEVPFYFVDETKMNSKPLIKKELENHFYNKIMHKGEKFMKVTSDIDFGLTILPQYFVSLFSGCSMLAIYIKAVQDYGAKGLIFPAITTGTSLIHELRFNRKLKKLENSVE